MKRFNEAVISLALKLNYFRKEDKSELLKQFHEVSSDDLKISFDRFLQAKGLITLQESRRLRVSVTSIIAPKIPKYRMIEFLGGGGMGEVYKAKQNSLDRFVAIKILNETHRNNADYLARFRREARAAAKVKHKNIVKIYDVNLGKQNRKIPPYFVMEFVLGKTLHEIIQSRKQLGVKQVLGISIAIADAIEAINRSNLVHRDIKPDNIMLTPHGEVKLCDLGLAKEMKAAQNITQPGITHGTPHYMSPEQAQGKDNIDSRSDMYSLGCTIYKLLTGNPPYVENSAIEILMKHISAPIPRISEIRPDVPEDLDNVITILLQKNPEKRYLSPVNLKNDLIAIYKGKEPNFDLSAAETETQFTIDFSLDPDFKRQHELLEKEVLKKNDDLSPAQIVAISPINRFKRRKTLALLIIALLLGIVNYYLFFINKPAKPSDADTKKPKPEIIINDNNEKKAASLIKPDVLRDFAKKLDEYYLKRDAESEKTSETKLNKMIDNIQNSDE